MYIKRYNNNQRAFVLTEGETYEVLDFLREVYLYNTNGLDPVSYDKINYYRECIVKALNL